MFWSQFKGDKGLGILPVYNNLRLICYGSDDVSPATFRVRKIRNPSANSKYSADHGPLPPLPVT